MLKFVLYKCTVSCVSCPLQIVSTDCMKMTGKTSRNTCFVIGCSTNTLEISERRLFCLPRNREKLEIWLNNLKTQHLPIPELSQSNYRICMLHFSDYQFQTYEKLKLNKNAIPKEISITDAEASSSTPVSSTFTVTNASVRSETPRSRRTMEITFTGKRVLVTGAGQGIGRGIAKRLVQIGAKVIALGRTLSQLESLKVEHPSVELINVDLSDWNKTREALKNLGHVDALVNNAAVAHLASFLNITPEEFDKTFAVNVKSVINVSQIVAKEWVENKTGGAIVNISSQASQAALQDHTVYCASKSAVDSISRVMALELGPHNIRINCVNPTVILTEMGRLGWSDPKKADPMKAKIPLGRFGEVDEVVDAVLYLLSDKASMITGVSLPIDGGFLAT